MKIGLSRERKLTVNQAYVDFGVLSHSLQLDTLTTTIHYVKLLTDNSLKMAKEVLSITLKKNKIQKLNGVIEGSSSLNILGCGILLKSNTIMKYQLDGMVELSGFIRRQIVNM